jgi:phosphomannomutase
LERLGCRVSGINLETDGKFPRAPEPLPENLGELSQLVRESGAVIGLAVDPDVDRLALVDETGRPIGEDYTLAFAVRSVLDGSPEPPSRQSATERPSGARQRDSGARESFRAEPPVVVANLSTSLVVEDAARMCGARFVRAAVGEANVARAIRDEGAVIGGEGNGGVILPALHIGRDAPVGVALILHLLARSGQAVSRLVAGQPQYRIVKAKGQRGKDLAPVYAKLTARFSDAAADTRDGLRLAWKDRWVHIRPSGTEPIVRFIAEAPTAEAAEQLVSACRELMA